MRKLRSEAVADQRGKDFKVGGYLHTEAGRRGKRERQARSIVSS